MKSALLLLLSVLGSLRNEASGSQSYDVCHQTCNTDRGLRCEVGCSCGEYYHGWGVCQLKPGWTAERVTAVIEAQAVMEAVLEASGDAVKHGMSKVSKIKMPKIKLPKMKGLRFGIGRLMKLLKTLSRILRFRG
uniref:Putative secreted protein n=1 Tax=Amblyomma americanum TaxID=6943 RepID=A0A0C9S4D9_AMBAM